MRRPASLALALSSVGKQPRELVDAARAHAHSGSGLAQLSREVNAGRPIAPTIATLVMTAHQCGPRIRKRREKPALQRADRQVRYCLVVSLRAPVQVDLYTPIETVVGIPVEVNV